jgi:hypothetical protein
MRRQRVAGHVHRLHLHAADVEALAVGEQVVELAAVGQEAALQVVELAEGGLHLRDVRADGDAAAGAGLDVARGGQVVGVCVGLQDPLQHQAVFAQVGHDGIGPAAAGAAGLHVEVEHRVDHGGGVGGQVFDHVRERAGGRVEERLDAGAVHVGLGGGGNHGGQAGIMPRASAGIDPRIAP